MARRTISLDEKIEKAQKEVASTKSKYDFAVEEFNKLLKKRQEFKKQELLRAFEASPKTYDEIIQFLSSEKVE
ncbi:MAG: ErpK protein [Lachnospiraceae bacterium]